MEHESHKELKPYLIGLIVVDELSKKFKIILKPKQKEYIIKLIKDLDKSSKYELLQQTIDRKVLPTKKKERKV